MSEFWSAEFEMETTEVLISVLEQASKEWEQGSSGAIDLVFTQSPKVIDVYARRRLIYVTHHVLSIERKVPKPFPATLQCNWGTVLVAEDYMDYRRKLANVLRSAPAGEIVKDLLSRHV